MMNKHGNQRWDIDTLRARLALPLSDAISDRGSLHLEYLCKPKPVADDATKLLVLDEKNKRVAVILVSSKTAPKLIERCISQARDIKQHLGPTLGKVILDPLASGTINTSTYTILPYCQPISKGRILKRVHRIALRPTILEWLAQITEATARTPDKTAIHSGFITPLEHLATIEGMSPSIRSAALETIGRIQTGAWLPRHVVMHGDLWEGNILFSNKKTRDANNPFASIVIIDWPGGLIDGYAMYDIVRLGMSMKLSKGTLRSQIKRHCLTLECDTRDARSYLLTALGHLGMNLGCFPPGRYANMAANCVHRLNEAIDS